MQVAGRPREFFNQAAWADQHAPGISSERPDWQERFPQILADGTTPNGVFGAKLHWGHLMSLGTDLGASRDGAADAAYALLASFIPHLRFVWFTRKNSVARAISHFRAHNTNRWAAESFADVIEASNDDLKFDFPEIDKWRRWGEFQEQQWRKFFARHEIRSLPLVYEEWTTQYEETIRIILDFLGIEYNSSHIPSPRFHKQADARSAEWEQRYRAVASI